MTQIWIRMTPICGQMTPICFQMTPIGGWQIPGWGLLVGFGVTVMDPEPPTWEIIWSGNFPGFWPCVLSPEGSPCTCRGCSASWCPCPRTPSWVLCQFCHTEKKGNDQPLAQLTLVVLVAGHNCLLTPWLQMFLLSLLFVCSTMNMILVFIKLVFPFKYFEIKWKWNVANMIWAPKTNMGDCLPTFANDVGP